VDCERREADDSVRAALVRVQERLGHDWSDHTDFDTPIALRWGRQSDHVTTMPIDPDRPMPVGLLRSLEDERVVYIETTDKTRFGEIRTLGPGTYRLTVPAYRPSGPNAHGAFVASFDGSWESLTLEADPPTRQGLLRWFGRGQDSAPGS
jgi:hypothetical protein